MAVTEEARNRLYNWLMESGGQEVASTMMDLLPPVGWADVATKRDLDHLRMEFRADLSEGLRSVEVELRGVQRELRLQIYWIVGSILTAMAMTLGVLAR